MRITTKDFRYVLSRLARSTADLVSKNGRFWAVFRTIVLKNPGRSPVCQVGVCNEGRCSSMAIGLSNDGKRVFNKACPMPWRHTVVHFEVKMSRF